MFPKYSLYIHTPVPVFKARINMVSITYPAIQLIFDTVTLGAYTDIKPDMTLLLGTTEGADDLGRVRVKYLATSTIIPIARISKGTEDGTLNIQDNAYITVLDDYRAWAKIPYFNLDNGIDYKDANIPVGTFNTEIPPKANGGPGTADVVDSITGLITVTFPVGGVNLSYPMAEGATIVSHDWDVADGTITVGTSASDVITATFPAGFRYVRYTVVDSNDRPHTAILPVLAIDPADDPRIRDVQVTQRLEKSGQTLDIQIYDELARADYPDGTLVMFWWDGPTDPEDRSHMKFIGWLDTERNSTVREKRGLRKTTSLHAVDICGRLNQLPGFPQALSRVEEESPWSYMPDLDINKSLFYLLFWHTTALELADFILPSDGDDYDAMRLDSGAASLFQQVNNQAQKMVPDHYLTCNSKGQMTVRRDWRLDDVGDRPIASIITEDNWNDLSFDYNRHPKYHVLRSGAIQSSTTFIEVDGEETLPLVFSIAPGDDAAFSQGAQEATENEGLALSQAALNKCEGHRYAMLNSRFGQFSFKDPTASLFWDYEPALMNRVQLNVGAVYAAQRGLPFDEATGMVESVSVSYTATKRGTKVDVSVTWTKEEEGFPATTYTPEDTEDVDYVPPPAADPTPGLIDGQQMVAGIGDDGFVYRTTDFQTPSGSGGPTWDRVDLSIAEAIFSWVVDPFSPGYIVGTGEINGWIATETDIYRVEDLFGTPIATSVHTFAEAVTLADGHWRSIQASFGTYFAEGSNPWLLCVSYYGATSGHEGTWALRSVDGGATWAEVLVSAYYDNGPVESDLPIAVYTSPKTPGLAYTCAHIETTSPALADGFVSTDWGETWAAISGAIPDDVIEQLPRWRIWDNDATAFLTGSTLSGRASAEASVSASGAGGSASENYQLVIGPPADTERVSIKGRWTTDWGRVGTPSLITQIDPEHSANLDQVEDLAHTIAPNPGGFTWQDFDIEWTHNQSPSIDWPNNRDVLPTATSPTGGSVVVRGTVSTGGGESLFITAAVMLRVTEIELDDATVYTPPIIGEGWLQPGESLGGALHLPWPDNADEGIGYYGYLERVGGYSHKLIQAIAGVQTDISPVSGAVSYGVNGFGFTVRSYDGDRNFMAVAGIGNDAGTQKVALFVSDDAGATWTEILAPVAATAALYSLQIAFSGDNPDVLFTWGGYSNGSIPAISYSSDFGTLDSREGNINSLGTVAFVGIAGGPTP